ncbi:hypothetical protein ACI2K4_32235 [Micromonospora sp. NPDC050397]|uniref:hypothetical protein n=1 Tax=Micromonospora sp. NPDC050397 TaxID=3364279 RepID=UPI00384D9E8E
MSVRLWLRAVPVIAVGLLVLPLAACGQSDAGPPLWEAGSSAPETPTAEAPPATPPAPSPTVAPTTPGASVTPRPSASRTSKSPSPTPARVSIVRTGGSTQGAQSLTVEEDGRWSYRAGSRDDNGTLNASQRQRLQGLLADPKLAAEGREANRPRCRNASSYALNTGRITVVWQACPSGAPATASAIVRLLEGITPL